MDARPRGLLGDPWRRERLAGCRDHHREPGGRTQSPLAPANGHTQDGFRCEIASGVPLDTKMACTNASALDEVNSAAIADTIPFAGMSLPGGRTSWRCAGPGANAVGRKITVSPIAKSGTSAARPHDLGDDYTARYPGTAAARLCRSREARNTARTEARFGLGTPVAPGTRAAEVLRLRSSGTPPLRIVCCHSRWKVQGRPLACRFPVSAGCTASSNAGRPLRDPDIAALVAQLRDCKITLRREAMVLAHGVGANALDHPALALAFLADMLARQPQFDALAAGEIVTTGTLTAAVPIKPGETWTSTYDGLPGVSGLKLTLVD